MGEASSWEECDRVDSPDTLSWCDSTDNPMDRRSDRGATPSSLIGSLYCIGGVEETREGGSSCPSKNQENKSSERISRYARKPLQSTDILNKGVSQEIVSLQAPSNAGANSGTCFPDTLTSLLNGRGGCCNCAGTSSACGSCRLCWDSNSNQQMFNSFRGAATPSRESSSIPVIEALGVTPKSKDRLNKYSVSGAMNPPGISIPTPAPRKKKYMPSFGNIPESITAVTTPNEAGTSYTKDVASNEDDFLPQEIAEVKENGKLYSEAELLQRVQDALSQQEKEFASKLASASEDSDFHFQQQLQKQLEEQGMLWNKDMQERLDANRSHYKKKQSSLKSRISDLEKECQSLQKSKEEDLSEHKKQTEELRLQLTNLKLSNEIERCKLLAQIAQQSEELSRLDEEKSNWSDKESQRDPAIIEELQSQIRILQYEKEEATKSVTKLEKQVINLQGSLSTHSEALESYKNSRKKDQIKILELETQLVETEKENENESGEAEGSRSHDQGDDGPTLARSTLQSSPQEQLIEKVKGVIKNCIQTISASNPSSPLAATPFDEKDSLDLLLQTLETAVSGIVRQLVQVQASAKTAMDSKLEGELEIARLTEIIDNRISAPRTEAEAQYAKESEVTNKDAKFLQVQTYWEQKVTEPPHGQTPRGQSPGAQTPPVQIQKAQTPNGKTPERPLSNRESLQSEALELLKRDIEALRRRCGMEEGPTKELLEDYASELHKKVEKISDELQILQHQLLKGANRDIPLLPAPSHANTFFLEPSEPRKHTESHDLRKQAVDLQSKLARTEESLSEKEEALENLRNEYNAVVRALGASQERVDELGRQVKDLRVGQETGQDAEESTDDEQDPGAKKGQENAESQVEDLLVILEMKQEKEKLSDKIREQEEELSDKIREQEEEILSLRQSNQDKQEQLMSLEIAKEKMQKEISALVKRREELQDELLKEQASPKLKALTAALDKRKEEAKTFEEEKQETQEKLSDLTSKCDVLAKALDEQKEEAASLNRDKKLVEAKLSESKEKCDDMARDATKFSLERSFLKNKLDSIIKFIERGDDGTEFTSTIEAIPDDLDSFQKLDRIEQHLTHVWREFAQKISSQRELLGGMKEKIADLKSESEETILRLQSTVSELENNLSSKKIEIDAIQGELSLAQGEALQLQKAHQEALGMLATSSQELEDCKFENERLCKRITEIETERELKAKMERELEAANAGEKEELSAELEMIRSKCAGLQDQLEMARSRISELESILETNNAECERLDRLLTNRDAIEEELLMKSAELEATSKATIERCEGQVRQVREEHAKEIDELLNQLDLVEAEHRENCLEKEKTVKEKDAIIAALGTQLAESQGAISALKDSSTKHSREVEKTRTDFLKAKNDADILKAELEKLQAAHAEVLEKREEAIEAAREETIQEATVQFQNFNELYRTMTSNYKIAAKRVQELEKELDDVKKASDDLEKEHASTVATMNSDLAEMKATQAREDAAKARALKEHKDAENGLRTKLSEAETNNRSIQKLLATVVAEKEDLIAENEELKSVCEEAMSLAEHTHGETTQGETTLSS